MFKLKLSLVLAIIAALVIILSGLLSEVRLITVFLRSVVGFLAAGVFVWVIAFVLETQNIVGFDKNIRTH